MNSSQLNRNKMVGVIMMLFGFVMLGLGGYLVIKPKSANDALQINQVRAIAKKQCTEGMKALWIDHEVKGESVSLVRKTLDNPRAALSEASLALRLCPGYEIKSFCYGADCEEGRGMYMEMAQTLKRVKEKQD